MGSNGWHSIMGCIEMRHIGTDKIIAIGMVVALLISMFLGSQELQRDLVIGLFSYLSRGVVDSGKDAGGKNVSDNKK